MNLNRTARAAVMAVALTTLAPVAAHAATDPCSVSGAYQQEGHWDVYRDDHVMTIWQRETKYGTVKVFRGINGCEKAYVTGDLDNDQDSQKYRVAIYVTNKNGSNTPPVTWSPTVNKVGTATAKVQAWTPWIQTSPTSRYKVPLKVDGGIYGSYLKKTARTTTLYLSPFRDDIGNS